MPVSPEHAPFRDLLFAADEEGRGQDRLIQEVSLPQPLVLTVVAVFTGPTAVLRRNRKQPCLPAQ